MTDMTATLQTDEECWKFWAEAGNKGLKANGEKAVLRAHESSCLAALFLIAGQHPEVEKLAPELRAAGLVCCIIDHRHPHFEKLSKDGISAVLHRPVDEAPPLPLPGSVAKSKVQVQAVFGAKNSPEVKDPPKREQSEEREVRNAEALPETAAFFGSSDSDSEDDAKPASPSRDEQPPIRGAAPKSSVVPLSSRPKVAKHTTEARCVVEPDKDSEEEDEESSEEDEEEEAPQKEDQKKAPKSQQESPKQSTAKKSRCILSEDESSDVSDDRSSPRPAENAKDSASKVTSSVRFGRRRSPLPRLRQKRREERRRAERSDRSRRDSRSSSRRRSRSRRASAEASPARFPFAARGQPRSKRKAEPPRLKSRRERSQEERERRRDEEYKEHRQRYRREVELRTHRERQRQDEELREQKEREKREKELKEQKEREQREKERREREHREKERKEKEQREREAREREQRERARREREQREKEAREREQREREQREREQRERERREREQREKETREREQKERELRELREREQREQELRQLKEREERERVIKELQERERRERELKELQERERRERELKELQERERRERELKELQERERRERELKELQERERRERELKELQERERREKELREQQEKELQAARDQDRKREPKSQPAPDPRMPTQAAPSAPDSKPLFVMHVGAEQDQAATAFKEASRIAANLEVRAKENRQAGSSTSQANLSELQLGGPKLLKVERHKDHPMAQIKLNQQETAEQILRLRPSHINGVPVKNWERLSNDPSAFLILWEGDRNALDDATLESHFNQMIQQLIPQMNPPPTQSKDDEEDKRLMEQINKAIEDTRKARGVQELQQKVLEDLEFKMVSVYEDMIVRQRFLDHARNRQDSFQNLSDAERQMLAQFQSDLQQLQQTHALLEREMESKLFPWEREALYARLRAKKHQAAQQAEAKLQMHVREQAQLAQQAQQAQQAQLAQQQAQQLQQAYMQQMQQAQLQQAQIRQQRQQYQLQQAQMQHMQRQTQQAPWEQSQVKDAAMNDQYHLAQQLQEQIHWEEHLVESRSPPRPICKTQAQAPPPPPPPPKDAENASPGVTGNAPPVVPIIVPKEGSLLGKARTFASDSNIPPGVIALQAGLRPEGRPIVPRNLLQEAKEGPPKKFTPPIPASTGNPGGIMKAPTLTASLPAPPPKAQIAAHLPPSFAAAPAEDAAPCTPCMEGTTPKPRSVVEPSDGSSAKCPPRTRPVGKAPMQIMPEGLDAVSQPGLANDAMAAPPSRQGVIKARRRIYEPPETLPEFPPEEEIVEIDPETTSAPAPATPPAPAMSFPPDTPDGLPLDGSAANGSAPDGVPSDGFPPHDPAPDTFPSDGSAPRGLDADGSVPHPPDALPLGGSSPDGSPPDGLPPDGLAPPGSAPDILDVDGSTPHGLDADDLASDGLAPDTPEICPASPDGLPPGSFAPDAFQADGSAPDISLPDGSWPDGLPPDGFVPDGPVPDSLPVDGSTPGFPDSLPSDDFPPDSSHPDSLPTGGFPPDGSGPPDSFPPVGSAPDPPDSFPPDGSAPDPPDSFPPDGSAPDLPDSFPPDGSALDPPDSIPPDGSAPDPPDSFPPDGSAPDPPDSFPPDGSAPDSTIEDVLSDSVLRDDPNNDIAVEASAPVPHPSPAAPIPAWSVRRSTFQTAIANLKRASAGRAASATLGRPLIKPFLKAAVHRAQHPQGGQASTLEWQSSESNRAEEVPPTRGSWSKNNAWSWKGKGRWKPHWAQAHQSGENQDQLKWKEADQANQVHQSWEDQDQPKWKEADQANQAHHSWEDQDQPEWNQADEASQVHQSWENKDQPKWKEAHELNQGQQSWEDQDQPKWKEADQAPQSWEDQDQQKEAQAQQSWADHDQRKEADQAQQSWEDQDQQKEAQAQQSWADHDQRKEADQAQQSWEDQDQQKEAGQAQQSWGDQDQPERKEADQANQAHQSWEALDQGTAPEQDSDQKPGHLSEIVTTQVKRLPRPKLQAPENASAKRRLRLPQGLDPGSSSSWAKDPGSSSYASARHGVLCMQAARRGTPVPEPNIPPSRASWAQPENGAPVPEPSMPPSKASWAEAANEGTLVPEPDTPVPEPSRPPAENRGTPVPEPSRPPSRDVEWHNNEWHKDDEDLVRFGATAAPKASAASKGSGKFGHFRPAYRPPLTPGDRTAFSVPGAVTAVPSKGKGVKRLRDEMGKSGRPGYMAWGASNPNSRFGYK